MNKIASQLRALRERTGLTVEQLAAQVATGAASLRDGEEGTRTPPTAVLARCAMLVGLELDEFLRGASVEAAPTALLRTAAEAGADALQALRTDHVPLLCGELVHRARVVQMVERHCGIPRARLPTVARGTETRGEHPAETDARRARAALGVEDGPIRSMRSLLERHGVLIVWTPVADTQGSITLSGSCITSTSYDVSGSAGTLVVAPGELTSANEEMPESCTVDIEISFRREGTADPAFDDESYIVAYQARRASFVSDP